MNGHAAAVHLATDMDGEDVASFMSAPDSSPQCAEDNQGYATEALSILHELSKRRQQLSGLTKPILARASHVRKQHVPGAGKGTAVPTQWTASTHQPASRKSPQPHDWTKSAPIELSSYSNPLFDLVTPTPPVSATATCASPEGAAEAPKASAAASSPPAKPATPLDVLKATRLRAHSALHREGGPSGARAPAACAVMDHSIHAAVVAELEAAKKREASLAQQLSRARADSVAQKQQLEHQRQLSKELAAAGRAAREALGKMADQNARLVAAYASTKQQLQALQAAQQAHQAQEQYHCPPLHHLQPHTPDQPPTLQSPQQQPTTPPAPRQQRPLHTTPPQQRGVPKTPPHRGVDASPASDQQQRPSLRPTTLPRSRAAAQEFCPRPRHQDGGAGLHDGTGSEDGALSDACTDFSSASTSSACSDVASSSQDDLQSDSGDLQSDNGDVQSDGGNLQSDSGGPSSTGRCSETGSAGSEAVEGVEEGGRQLREACRSSDTSSEGAEDGRQLGRVCSSPRNGELEEAEQQAQQLVVQNQQLMQAHLEAEAERERERERQAEEVQQEAECLKQEGNRAFARQQHADAVSCYSGALALQPLPAAFRAIVHCNRAAALHCAGSYVEAIADCFHALHLDPSYTRPLQRRADAFCALGDYSNAVPDLRKACSDQGATKELQQRLWEVQHRARTAPLVNHYAVLQVPSSSGPPDIKAAYKKLALKYHPDKATSAAEKAAAAVLFRLVSSAHAVLSSTEKRRAFDAARLRRKLRNSFTSYHC